jgi:hypothetical protein
MTIIEALEQACLAALNQDESVDLDEAGTQILNIREILRSNAFMSVARAAGVRLDQMIADDYTGCDTGGEAYTLGKALGYSKEEIDEALNKGYL